jgi:glycosyltransferase involved in cell wall biosynthesis
LKNSKKVAICLNASWNIYNFRLNLARALKKAGYEVVLIAPYDKYSELLKKEFEYYDIYMNNKGTNPIEDMKTLLEFFKLFKKIKPDVMLGYTIKPNVYGNMAAHSLGIKTINNIAGLGTLFSNGGILTKIAKFLYKISQKNSSQIFFQNREDYEMFTSENIVDKNKCDILPGSGIDTTKFVPIETKKDGVFRFLLLSRMLWEKGVGEYVEAAKIIKQKYKNVEFQLLGFLDVSSRSAISKEQMDEWVKEGYVTYLGVSDNVKEIIAKVDCVVLPSYYREGTPRTLLESASMAKPIITTDNVGCRNIVDDEVNGYLCNKKDVNDLIEKMEKMLNLSEEERKKMGEAGREKMIKEFDEKIVIDKYLQAIKELL